MNDPQVKIVVSPSAKATDYLNVKTHEAVLFFSTPVKKKPVFVGIGSRPTHKDLLPKLVKGSLLTEKHTPALYDQVKTWGVGEITFHSLGSKSLTTPSTLSRLESFTDRFRMAGADLTRQHIQSVKRKKEASLLIDMSDLENAVQDIPSTGMELDSKALISAFIEGLYLGTYHYGKYKSFSDSSEKPSDATPLKQFTVVLLFTVDWSRLVKASLLDDAKVAAQGVSRARNLVNDPPNDLHSEAFVREARKIASDLKVSCRVFGKAQLQKMKMNALLAVNAGSRHEAKLAVLDNGYSGKSGKKTFLLVGKGVLFDSGGLSLKPSSGMIGMKMDMAGGAAVLAAFEGLVKIKTKARVVAIIPLTDNMTGERAMKVGDVIRTHSGKTVEVLNTDAEGRLILSDALDYGIKTYRPDYIIDLATLTGACVVALGTYYAGLFTPGDDLAEKLLESSRNSDEALWRLPLDDLYAKELQSDIADLKNIGSSYGGATTAAKFLEQFVPEKYRHRWAHLDIAPVMEYSATKGYQVKGASGFGVRLLMDFVKKVANK